MSYKLRSVSKSIVLASLLVFSGLASVANAGGHKAAGPGDIVDVAAGAGSFNTWLRQFRPQGWLMH